MKPSLKPLPKSLERTPHGDDRKPVPKHRRASQLIPERRLRVDRGCVTHETLQVHDAKG
jgi:hypothetical protein